MSRAGADNVIKKPPKGGFFCPVFQIPQSLVNKSLPLEKNMQKKSTYLIAASMITITVFVFRFYQEVSELEKLRAEALQGSLIAMQTLRDTKIYIVPYERCAWALLLAEDITGMPVPINALPVCSQSIRPEGEYLVREYAELLKARKKPF